MLLSEAVNQWIAQRRAEGHSEDTLKAYRIQMGLLIRHMGDMPVEQVTLAHLREYASGPASEGRKLSTIAHRVRMIKSFFTWSLEEDHIPKSPAHKLKEPKLPKRIPKALPFKQLELVRHACATRREHALVEMLFATGCRVSDLSRIQKDDVDFQRQAIVVLGKGRKEREVYYGARAELWLSKYLEQRDDSCPYLFVTELGKPRQLKSHQIWWIVKQIGERVGLRAKVWPHVFRHTLGTTLLNQGADLNAVQDILGHEDPKTTRIYAHLSGANRQAAYQRHFIQ